MKATATLTPLLCMALLAGCGDAKRKAAEKERQDWLASLNDSIALYQTQIQEVQSSLGEARNEVGAIIDDFEYVNNSREVEGYHILHGWKNRYPLQTTGLVARVTEGGGLELIATLAGGTFDRIAVTSGGETAQSETVPHDQALNYRAGNLTRVCFTGGKADTIGALIAARPDADVLVAYTDGKPAKEVRLPADQRAMVASTWRLYDAQRRLRAKEMQLPRLNGKINACRRLLDENNTDN